MEPLTTAQVSTVLHAHLGQGAVCRSVERGPIGNGQETWFLHLSGPDGSPASADEVQRRLVLRRTAPAGPLEWTSRTAEATVMRAAAAAGVPVPEVHLVETDPEVLGAPFMLMDFVPGVPLVRTPRAQREQLSADLMTHLAALHRAGLADPDERDAAEATRAEISRWRRRAVGNAVPPPPLVEGLLSWAHAAVPAALAEVPAVQLWGDAGAHNALGEAGEVTGLLDWELAHFGHPLEDLAAAIWMEGDHGVPQRALVEAYEAAAEHSVDPEVLRFFLALTCVTRSIMILAGAAAFATGRSNAPNLAGLGLDLPAQTLGRAAELAGWGTVEDRSAEIGSAESAAADPTTEAQTGVGPRPSGAEIDEGVARFLRDDVLPMIDDGRTRRGLKTAAALLETAAVRAHHEPAVQSRRTMAEAGLRATLRDRWLTGDLGEIAARVESEDVLADLRPAVRRFLLDDLALDRALLGPLRRLYE